MRFILSAKAADDLEQIWFYTSSKWSRHQADHYLGLIFQQIRFIAENPESGVDFGRVKDGYFRTRVKSHFIFYKVNPSTDTVQIIRILHQRMDFERCLGE